MPEISVIVPVYKVEPYLRRCVDSILKQTFSDFELILVDDGSPDNCPVICDEYAEKDCRVSVIHQSNQGIAAARHHGVNQAQADWICFVDSDDMIHPQMLEHLYMISQETGAGITVCGAVEAETVPADFWACKTDAVVCRQTDEQGLLAIQNNWKYCYWVVWGKLIPKTIIQKYPMTEGRAYEDNAIVFRWLHEAGMVAYTSTPYYFYQVNKKGITKSEFSLTRLDSLWALQEQISFYRKVGYTVLDKKMTAKLLVDSVWNIDRCISILNDQETANDIRRKMKANLRGMRLSSLPLTEYHRKCVWEKLYPRMAYLRRILRKSFKRFKSFVKSIICK